jgi:hypothetical protein
MHKVSRQVLTIQDTKEHEQYKGQTASQVVLSESNT